MNKDIPVIAINPDIEVMNPDDFEDPAMYVVVAKDEPLNYCDHLEIRIFPHHRVIECRKCNKRIEAFDYILMAGRFANNFLSHMKYLKIQMDRLIKEDEELRQLYRKMKKSKRTL